MSLVTVSKKRNRVYQRRFDHEEAAKRHHSGESMMSLAREYGVSVTAIERVVKPGKRERMNFYTRRSTMSGVCIDCGKTGITKRSSRCMECSSRSRITTVRPDTIHCGRCERWLPDDAFRHSEKNTPSHRYRNRRCRECETQARKEYRDRNKVPCDGGCGIMVEGKGRSRRGAPGRPFLCRNCWNRLQGLFGMMSLLRSEIT